MNQKNVLIKESIQTKKSFTDNKEATVAAGNILFQNGKTIFNNDILVSFEEALNNFDE